MDEKNLTRLDDYFNGLLDEVGRQEILELVRTDEAFREEFLLRQKMEDWLASGPDRARFSQNIAGLGDEFFISPAGETSHTVAPATGLKVAWRKPLTAAAAILLLAAAVWFLTRPEPSLYRQFARHDSLQLSLRDNSADPAVAAAEKAFNSGDFATAQQHLRTLTAQQPDSQEIAVYSAVCLIELDLPAEARAILEPIARGSSAWQAEARWYLALSYLKENNRAECREVLEQIPPEENRYEEAQELLRVLNDK